MEPDDYGIVYRGADSAHLDPGQGYFWGTICGFSAGEVEMRDVRGPFRTAGEAGIDMLRTWITASAEQPVAN